MPLHPGSQERIAEYLESAGHAHLASTPLFRPRPQQSARRPTGHRSLTADGVYQLIKFYGKKVGIAVARFGPHAARATAATNALDAGADIAKVQGMAWARQYQHHTCVRSPRKTRPEDSPVFKGQILTSNWDLPTRGVEDAIVRPLHSRLSPRCCRRRHRSI